MIDRLLKRLARVREMEANDPKRFAPNPLGPGFLTRRDRYRELIWEIERRIGAEHLRAAAAAQDAKPHTAQIIEISAAQRRNVPTPANVALSDNQRWTILNALFAAKQSYQRDLVQRAYLGNKRIIDGVKKQIEEVQAMYDLLEEADSVELRGCGDRAKPQLVQIDNDEEIACYAVYLMSQAGVEEQSLFPYGGKITRGDACDRAAKLAVVWANQHKVEVATNF